MGSEVTQLACGRCHVLVYLAKSNRLYSFGLGGSGQLGIGLANLNRTGPTLIKTDLITSNVEFNFLFLFNHRCNFKCMHLKPNSLNLEMFVFLDKAELEKKTKYVIVCNKQIP